MRIPESILSLVEHGVVDEVIRSLKSGKEADVYLVASEGFFRVAKVYKDAQSRSFKNRAAYTEGRQVRSSRDQRAMDKGSRYGKAQNEEAWQSAEVDMIYRLDAAGVRVPKPHHFIDGVLLMELVATAEGQPAPRLGEVEFSPEEARAIFARLLEDVVKMLCAGVVHGDLSEFNVLVSAEGPVVIDFPQAVNAARNQSARKMLVRDVDNLQRFLQRHAPGTPSLRYAEEMWQLYEKGELSPTSQLTGRYVDESKHANTAAVLDLIEDARRDERFKRQASGRSFRGLGQPGAKGEAHAPGAHPPGAQQHRPPQQVQQQRPPQHRPQQGAQQQRSQPHVHPPRAQHGAQPPRPQQPPSPQTPSQRQHHGAQQHRPPQPQRASPGGQSGVGGRAPNPQGRPHPPPSQSHAPQSHAPRAHAAHTSPSTAGAPHARTHPPRPSAPRPHAAGHPHGRPQGQQHGQAPGNPRGNPQGRGGPRGRPAPIVETKPQLGVHAQPAPPREPGSTSPGPHSRK